MTNGFVYILMNPAFPTMVKIGKTEDNPENRARKLSGATGVPAEFIVLFDALVSDSGKVERELHKQFASYRVKKRKEFFNVSPKIAIVALINIAEKYSLPPTDPMFIDDMLPFFKTRFSDYIDKNIISIRLVTAPGFCYLQIERDMEDTVCSKRRSFHSLVFKRLIQSLLRRSSTMLTY